MRCGGGAATQVPCEVTYLAPEAIQMKCTIESADELAGKRIPTLLADAVLAAGGSTVPGPRPVPLSASPAVGIAIPVTGDTQSRRGGTASGEAGIAPAVGVPRPSRTPASHIPIQRVSYVVGGRRVAVNPVGRRAASVIARPHRGGPLPIPLAASCAPPSVGCGVGIFSMGLSIRSAWVGTRSSPCFPHKTRAGSR